MRCSASFDTASTKNLNSLFFSAVEYGADFRLRDDDPTLYERLYERLRTIAGTDDTMTLMERCHDAYRALRGRTLGPPEEKFLAALCAGESRAVQDYLDEVKPQKRTRSGANFLATMLLFIKAAGIGKVMLFCDQLEDFASPQTPKKTRSIEVERFRDFIVELLPMADMVSVVVTMHPRALASIEEFWQLADLPSLRVDEANRHIVVVMPPLGTHGQAKRLLAAYINAARRDGATAHDALSPFTEDAIEELWSHSTKKPRDLLRKAQKMITFAATENLVKIDAAAVESRLALITAGTTRSSATSRRQSLSRRRTSLRSSHVISLTELLRDLFCLANAHLASGEAGDGRAFERRVERHLAATGVRPVEVFSGVRLLGSHSLSGLYHQIDATGRTREAVVIGEWKAYQELDPEERPAALQGRNGRLLAPTACATRRCL